MKRQAEKQISKDDDDIEEEVRITYIPGDYQLTRS